MHKIYHIYAGNTCLLHSIPEEEFEATWRVLNNLVGIMKTDYKLQDLNYEELTVNKDFVLNASY